jgi:hypothetical protein
MKVVGLKARLVAVSAGHASQKLRAAPQSWSGLPEQFVWRASMSCYFLGVVYCL